MPQGKRGLPKLKRKGDDVVLQSSTLLKQQRQTIYNPYRKRYEKIKKTQRARSDAETFKFKRNITTDDIWVGDRICNDNLDGNLRIWY